MKKVLLPILALALTVGGYAQVKKMSTTDAFKKAEVTQRFSGEESLANVANSAAMTRTDGELDYTVYDWQTNSAQRSWTITWEDGKANFAFTIGSTDYADRGTAVGTYDANADEWIPSGGRIENEKTGFGSIARYGENGIVVAAHNANTVAVFIIEDKDNFSANSVSAVSYLSATNNPTWPVVMTSGENRDIIHVVATASEVTMQGVKEPMIYFRSTDGGQTWDKQNEILPFMTSDYALSFSSNECYFMETTANNRLSLVVNSRWSDGMVIYSDDNGENWERKVFYNHPDPFGNFGAEGLGFMYPRWVSAAWDNSNKLHIAYEFNGTNGTALDESSSYYPGLGGVGYWNETMPLNPQAVSVGFTGEAGQPFVLDTMYLFQDIYASMWIYSDATHEMFPEYIGYLPTLDENGNPYDPYTATEFGIEDMTAHGSYNCGTVCMPVLCIDPATGEIVVVWCAMDEHNTDGAKHFFKLFARHSSDGGSTWSDMVQLTNDFIYSFTEYVYPQATIINGQLIVAVQADGATGTFVQNDDPDGSDNFYQGLTYDLAELFPTWSVEDNTVNSNISMNVYPNPATDMLNINLSDNSEVVIYNMMGQAVSTFEGKAGNNTIKVDNLNSGVYFIQAGNQTQKFVVK